MERLGEGIGGLGNGDGDPSLGSGEFPLTTPLSPSIISPAYNAFWVHIVYTLSLTSVRSDRLKRYHSLGFVGILARLVMPRSMQTPAYC